MKRSLIIFGAGLLVAIAGYFGFYLLGSAAERNIAQSPAPELAWLKQEFHLDDAEFQRISQMHGPAIKPIAWKCAGGLPPRMRN